VSRKTAIADDGQVLAEDLDHDLVSHDTEATDAAPACRPAASAKVFCDPGHRYVRLSSCVSLSEVGMVASR
jgi:hypothetical protein